MTRLTRYVPARAAHTVCSIAALVLVMAFGINASRPPTIENPYAHERKKWIKVNLHVHTKSTGASMTPCDAATLYASAGYGAIVLADKSSYVTGSAPVTPDPGPTCDTNPSGTNTVRIIPGYEDTQLDATGGHHLTVANVAVVNVAASNVSRQSAINYAIQNPASPDGVFIAFAHPSYVDAGWSNLMMQTVTGVNALEVWNGQGFDSSANLDAVLTYGTRVWVHAADDPYWPSGIDRAWDVVNANSNSRADILEALRSGRYYAVESPGHAIRCDVRKQDITCFSYLYEPPEIPFFGTYRWIGRNGVILRQTDGVSSDTYHVTGSEQYVRLVVSTGTGYDRVGSQPFFISQ